LGYHVFDVDYRLPPLAHWKDEVADVKCALGWVAANAAQYQIDPTRISVMGHSAGANLAMLAAYSVENLQLPPSCDLPIFPVKSVVNLYGPADLSSVYGSSGSLAYTQDALQQYLGGPLNELLQRYWAASPLSYVNARTPPTITFLGKDDRIVPMDQALALAHALKRANVIHETYLLPGSDHAFDVNWGGFGTQFTRDKLKSFLKKNG